MLFGFSVFFGNTRLEAYQDYEQYAERVKKENKIHIFDFQKIIKIADHYLTMKTGFRELSKLA